MEKPANAPYNDDFRHYGPRSYDAIKRDNEEDREKKKDKKWTLGGFFRRKAKKDEESSDEEEETKKGFLNRKRSGREKQKSRANGFDVVVPQYNASEVLGKTAEELWSGPKEPQQRFIFRQHDARIESNLSRNSSGGSGSLDSRKGRREVMARAQAKRDQMRDGSSSEDNESGQSSCSVTREGRRRRQGRPKIPSATPSPSRSPRVQPKMPLHGSASYPLPIHTYPPGYHWEVTHSPHRRTLLEYEQFLASCGSRNKSLSYDQDMHRAEAMFVQLPIARTRSSSIQAEAHGEVPNPKPEPPPRMRPVASRFDSTSSLPVQSHPMIQRSCSGTSFATATAYGNIHDQRIGSYQHVYQNYRMPNGVTKATVHYSQSSPKPVYSPKIAQSPPTDLRYYADQNPRSRNPIHITCSANPSPTNEQPYLSDSQLCRKSTKEFWRLKDQEIMKKQQYPKTDRSRSNSPTLMCVVNKPKPRQTAVIVARKIVHNFESSKASAKTPPEPPVRRHSKIDLPAITQSTTSNLDDALHELESIYKSLKLSDDHSTPVKQKPPKSPDRVADDMAVRRMTVKDTVENKKLVQQSYLQCSPVLGATPRHSPVPPVKAMSPTEPDITLDDVVYRNHRYANHALKTLDPQPPFGIPIGPVTPAANSDYLHVNPTEKLRNSFLASKVPDIVKDDLAFRNLRKDNLTANLPTSAAASQKKRAVRSLSENLFNILQKEKENAFTPIETNNNVIDNGYDKTQSMTDLNQNLQRDSLILEQRLKALKEEKSAKRAEFFQDKFQTPVASWSELRHSSCSVDNARQRSTSTETLTEENEMRLKKHFRSPIVELSKYPAAVPANALYQNPFKEQPAPLDESQLDDLLSKIAREAKITSEAIGRQLVELEVAVASDMLSPERKSKMCSLELQLRKNDKKKEESVKIVEIQVEPPPVTHKVSFASNLSQILAQVEQEHTALCQAFPNDDEKLENGKKTDAGENGAKSIATDRKDVIMSQTVYEEVKKPVAKNDVTGLQSDDEKPIFEPISDVSEIMDSEDADAFLVAADEKIDVFEEVYEYNCALLMDIPPASLGTSEASHDASQPICVGDEVKRIAACRGLASSPDVDDDADSMRRPDRGEHSRPRGTDPFGPDRDAGMNRRSSELSTTTSSSSSSDADRARERIERYKERRRQELSARYGLRNNSSNTSDNARCARNERDKTDPILNNKTETGLNIRRRSGAGDNGDKSVRETKASRLRAASHSNRTEIEKPVPCTSRRESVDKSQIRKSFLNRSHTSEPTKQDPQLTSRKSGSASPLITNGHSAAATATTTAKIRQSISHDNEKSAIKMNAAQAGRRMVNGAAKATQSDPERTARSPKITAVAHQNGNTTRNVEPVVKCNGNSNDDASLVKPSILKKKSVDESSGSETSPRPVSILKRKTLSQDGAVTFSPSVIDKEYSRKKQGILKKRRSLDECEVGRQRSLSPDRSILKNQRRLSMEDVNSILKNSTETLHEPHGILKRKSATPPLHTHHVTIADTVIMAAAAALGDIQPNFEYVRPILKKKTSSEEHTPEISIIDPLRPILKKKSVEVEDVQLVRPILKSSRKSSDEEFPSILKNNERVRARSVCGYERAKDRILPRPLSLAEPGTDFHNFLRNELQWSSTGDDDTTPLTDASIMESISGQDADKLALNEDKGGMANNGGNVTNDGKTLGIENDDAFSKLSFAERIGLFNTRIKETTTAPAPATRRPRAARFKTQPVTDEELIQVRPPGGVMVLPMLNPNGLKSILKRSTGGSGSESSDSEVKSILASREPKLEEYENGPNLAAILQNVNQEAERSGSSIVKSQSHSAVATVFTKKNKHEETEKEEPEKRETGLRRSTTQPLGHLSTTDEADDMSGMSIKERLAKLRQSGENGWQKRNSKLKNADEISVITTGNYLFNAANESSSVLAARLDQLDTAQEGWKARVQQTDAVKFTVEGKMGLTGAIAATPSDSDRKKRSPKQMKFRSRNFVAELHSSPASPSVAPPLMRSLSAPGGDDLPSTPPPIDGPVVAVPKTDDDAFEAFFQSILPATVDERLEFNLEDLDVVQRSESRLLVQKRSIQVQRRRRTVRNPVKSLALRSDLQDVYMEVKTGVAEKELRRLKGEKGGTHLAREALAGLASTEDFTAVNLKRPSVGPVQYPDVMLLRIKGRRHVETRLVEPVPASVNNGDCFIAVTRDSVALFMGEVSNVVEKARAKEVAGRIEAGELSCSAARISGPGRFWGILGGKDDEDATETGPPDEDEKIESYLAATNMVYELVDHELVPLSSVWGSVPKVEILQSTKNLVFDFGSEMYVWSGKCASIAGRREAAILARELWDEGFDYTECEWSPFGPLLGQRPAWALFCKISQNMEPVIFREKFQDWPDLVLNAKNRLGCTTEPDGSTLMEIQPVSAELMIRERLPWPDLELEGTHLGRGVNYLDEETRRLSEISDVAVSVWRVSEANQCEITDPRDFGQFREDSSYVVRWHYSVSVTVRDLKGAPSRHTAPGRDRFAYFLWHGRHSSFGDRGAAALHTVTLDTESAPQIVVPQLTEPPAFLRLFKGNMGIHRASETSTSLYLVRGSEADETVFVEVEPIVASLRSRACFIILNRKTSALALWCGSQASEVTKEIAKKSVKHILEIRPREFRLPQTDPIAFNEFVDGVETGLDLGLNGNKDDYLASVDGTTSRLFYFANTRGEFEAAEIPSPLLHPDGSFPYLFLQSDLYHVSQPGLFLLDAGDKLWLWHGWTEPDTAPSAVVRHQAQRRAAMQTALRYWELSRNNKDVRGSLVWAGLEPDEFIALFPFWELRDDVTEFNIKETTREKGLIVDMETELQRLTCRRYPLAVLLQRPLPDGVDPTQLEDYLEPDAFPGLFEMTRDEFMELPSWKKNTMKKDMGLF